MASEILRSAQDDRPSPSAVQPLPSWGKASAHLNTFNTKDFHQEVVAPAADSAFHGEAVFTRMLLQQR